MSELKQPGRRTLLRNILLGGAGLTMASSTKAAELCLRTPPQTKGPFYPLQKPIDQNTDLTIRDGNRLRARGQIIYIQGTVLGSDCQPVGGALVEIWQACESGRYDHPNDPNTAAELDPNFQYFGKALTGKDGRYSFKTILPGAYPADRNWMRPPHIHYRVLKTGYRELVTQLYFKGQPLNEQDLILQDLSREEQDSVVVELLPAPNADFELGSQVCEFNITLDEIRNKRRGGD
ncbi:MAG TPA: protocatechuate 3,4-dioxygenase [Bdellovibrionales bacterium]|jgi:protocatechuate 3,4-dioxygenase beta subunit|nr:protocatechuate 3,4-dioxygenase [Bdellovibrionales bacterium]